MRMTYYALTPTPADANYTHFIVGVFGKNSKKELRIWQAHMGLANLPFEGKLVQVKRCTKDLLPKGSKPDPTLSTERVKFYATPLKGIGGEGI